MNLNNYTQKSQEAILQAQHIAEDSGHQAIEPAHLLLALMTQEEGVVPAIVNKVAGSAQALRGRDHTGTGETSPHPGREHRGGSCPANGRGTARGGTLRQGHAG